MREIRCLILIGIALTKCSVYGQEKLFKSVPTTVKAPENDTVLLPCYLETVTNGKSKN